jgi:predicted ribosomally synthesized peptide with SipW-like signal peptide
MRKNLITILSVAIFSTIGVWVTRALFSDVERSSDNTFTTGKIDLKVDNTSYYNGELVESATWSAKDLEGELFFNFSDVKPGDWGEDTVSLRVDDNESWACVDINISSNDDNGNSEPELLVDEADDTEDDFDGELAQNLEFIFWLDDGDNVLEDSEYPLKVLAQGKASEILNKAKWILADSWANNLGGLLGEGMQPETEYFIGKAWCFGDLTPLPVADGDNSPLDDPGISCDGSELDNSSQTDKLTGDIRFYVEQHRNNADFACQTKIGDI